jgi:sugar (pentulose or hexulose) kinase
MVMVTNLSLPADGVWIGIDLGTQSVRVTALQADGIVVGQGSAVLSSRRPAAGRHEQQPEEWWQAVIVACQAAMATVSPSSVRGVAIDGTSGTILFTDKVGRPLTPGLMYDDARGADMLQLVNTVGQEVWSSLGYRMQASWALPKALWLLHAQPELSTQHLLHQTDFINRRLVGDDVPTDASSALKTGYDLLHEAWPLATFAQLDMPEQILPRVVRSGTQIGTISAEAARVTSLPAGVAVIAGMTDGCASQIGSGALRVGSWNAVLGTTLVLKGVTQELLHDPAGVVYSHLSPEGTWLPGGASSTGAGALSSLFPNRDLQALNEQAAQREPASVVCYPLVTRGERFPFTVAEAEGFTLGEPVDEIDRYAAVLQGVAFLERLCFDYLDYLGAPIDGMLALTGGGARSRYWCQLRADVLRRSVVLPKSAEASSGMALLAAAATTQQSLTEVATRMVRIRETIEPRLNHIERFHAPYLHLIAELEQRKWIRSEVALHARQRANA